MNDSFKAEFIKKLPYKPIKEQIDAIDQLVNFVTLPESQVCVFTGYAGTGKTSLVAALVQAMEEWHSECVLMAPTGRAAKVLAKYAGHSAFTIHKMIFRQANMDVNAKFSLAFNKRKNVLFIVDEASMMSARQDDNITGASLLDATIDFVFANNNGCKLLIVGDKAQLPPVNETDSPALCTDFFRQHLLNTSTIQLKEVIRQKNDTGILFNATNIRNFIEKNATGPLPIVKWETFADVVNVRGDELIDMLADCYDQYGVEETIVICRSNKTANIYNRGIRNQILWREELLENGDMVMVAKNNYFWKTDASQDENAMDATADFIANGDVANVKRVRNIRELYGFTFADCTLELTDYDNSELEAVVLLDTLNAEAPALTAEQQQDFFNRVMEDYEDIPLKTDRMKQLKINPYFNALQIKYAYAVTCHKAQGGQWRNVFIDQGFIPQDVNVIDYYRWLYTAFTRSTNCLFLVNWKNFTK